MRISDIQHTNAERAKRWHPRGIEEWSPLEWAGAMAGEAGEACNAAKKIKRVSGGLKNLDTRGEHEYADYKLLVSKEVADTIIYGLLLIELMGHDAEEILRAVFNKKSEEYGFPERL